ncbi:Hypothetical predicted protein [Paramuricea clavata]|uniref:Uncharacterized protein n=1 Tax=Paramuricea clavata TaxID=317549 RepID=A0A6S7GZT7_PARCT|nr:Hypothetical predicted protein [Paramuricea clavata]
MAQQKETPKKIDVETQTIEDTVSKPALNELPFDEILKKIDEELRKIARRDMNSVLHRKDFDAMSSFSLENILKELRTMCLVTFTSLSQMLDLDCGNEKSCSSLPYLRRVDV